MFTLTAAGFYLLGILLWGLFFNWGRGPFTYHDWAEITLPRLAFLKNALSQGVLPLHASNLLEPGFITSRYLTLPDLLLSPQVLLLRFMEIGPFILVNTLLLYSFGHLGLLWFVRKFQLSTLVFSILFLLFNFNGHILAHYSVGHNTWGGYFLFPWIAVLVFQLFEGVKGWLWATKMALLMTAIYLQGSFHQFIWVLLFLGMLAITIPRHFLTLLKALVFAVLLNMVRILPPVLHYRTFESEYLGGYVTLQMLVESLLEMQIPNDITLGSGMLTGVGMWEFTIYTGWAGLIFLLIFGVYHWIQSNLDRKDWLKLMLPLTGLVLLSMHDIFKFVRLLPVPLLQGERIASRIISLAFMFLLLMASIEFQRWLDRSKVKGIAVVSSCFLIILIAHDLWQNFELWSIPHASTMYPFIEFNSATWMPMNDYNDIHYLGVLAVGLVISLLIPGILLLMVRRETAHNENALQRSAR